MYKPNQTKLAEAIGATQSAVSLWYQGKFKPHKMFRKQLEEHFPEQLNKMDEAYAREQLKKMEEAYASRHQSRVK